MTDAPAGATAGRPGSASVLVVFALAAAVLFGSADFLGGTASRHRPTLSVLAISAPAGALLLLVAALAAGAPLRAAGLPWAAAAGVSGGVGFIIFYRGLAVGPMRLVAPVSALVSTVLPVGVAMASGERPGPLVYAGGGLCLVATVLVSVEGEGGGRMAGPPRPAPGLWSAAASGLAFGGFYLCLRNAGAGGVLWPSALARVTGATVLVIAAAWAGAPAAWRDAPRAALAAAGPGPLAAGPGPLGAMAGTRCVLAATVASGLLDATANVCYMLATRAGLFGIAVVLTALYPGVTVLLARVVLGERLRPVQLAGLVVAIAGIAAVSG